MRIKSIRILAITMALCLGLGLNAASAAMTLKLGTVTPAVGDRLIEACEIFKKYVEEKTGGAITITLYPASQLGGEREMLEALQMGTLEMASLTNGPFPNFSKDILVFDIPFVFPSEAVAYTVLDGPFGDKLREKVLKDTGVRCLGFAENGFRHFTTTNKPIRVPGDVKGLKIRVMENQAHMAMIRELGGIPTPMAFAELYTALAQGVVDGQENPISLTASMRYYEVQKYLTMDGHLYCPYLFMVNEDIWKQMTADQQKIVMEGVAIWRDEERTRNKKQSDEAEHLMASKGTEIIKLTPDVHAQFQKQTAGVEDFIRKQVSPGLIEELKKAIADAQAK
ncbi:TRAP dicarboxylate transporter, DctP subunit [uncultured delta proteobacterium]|uniref:TRAP dicarboxylate transporter, DctP subunit n=1 Tax=uncultured delta proteobacterium TaxID=34034 RepID=A0A212IW60_9DELT|nr:TRAP dicarboxylate transporter, DctP subunit [uncultured delta proteobacterium]